MIAKAKLPFDPHIFLTKVGDGRTIADYRKNQKVFSQGDPADAIFYIQNGKVKLTVISKQGKEAVVGILGTADFFGEGCLAGQPLRMATATAISACVIVRLEKRSTLRVLHDEPTFSELFLTYLLSLVFSLRTHKHLYAPATSHLTKEAALDTVSWSVQRAVVVLLLATGGVAVMSELLVGAVEHTAHVLGMTEVFVGVILVAIIGNAAEHSTAVLVAMKNQMELAINIAVGSSTQVAMFVAPVLVFLSYFFEKPMDLLFTRLEVAAVALSVWVLNLIAQDGESHWMEGVQLLALYAMLAVAFYFLPIL